LSQEVTNTWFDGIMDKETPAKNGQVIIKASTDRGKTFGDKINLSNSTEAESQDAQIDTFGNNGNNVIVSHMVRM
jgi:hypothetical protein